MALESGHVTKPNVGWYAKVNVETGEVEDRKYRLKDVDTAEFWEPILEDESFKQWVRDNYQFTSATGSLIDEESHD
jgi:hypothetical protein